MTKKSIKKAVSCRKLMRAETAFSAGCSCPLLKKHRRKAAAQSVEKQTEIIALCFMYFCVTKSTKSHLRGSLLEISLSFPALPKRAQRLGSVSVQTSCTPATPLYAGVDFRIRESARLLRVMCSHAWYRESHGERRT